MDNISVFTGPMKSGKSSHIIAEAKEQKKNGRKVLIFKPSMDDRFGIDYVTDRNGNRLPAINISSIDDLERFDAEYYFIDEFQFLDGDLDTITRLASRGKKFFIAGLDLTAEKKDFGKMGELMQLSNDVKKFSARCDYCGKEAIYSFCLAQKDGDVLVGTDDIYKAVCADCYERLSREKTRSSAFRRFEDDDDAR
jgi:thymidine kinase